MEGCPTLSLDQGPRQAEPQWLTSRLRSQLPDFLVPDPCECLVGEAGVQAGCWPADGAGLSFPKAQTQEGKERAGSVAASSRRGAPAPAGLFRRHLLLPTYLHHAGPAGPVSVHLGPRPGLICTTVQCTTYHLEAT